MNLTRVGVQCRAELSSTGKLGGYAAVFDQTTDLGPMGKERIGKSAFTEALKTSDTRSLYQHDPSMVLGRLSVGTLRLSVDSRGLEYEVDLPNTSYANDLRELVERGDIDGASFGFIPGLAEWDSATQTRTHTSVQMLVDVSPVTFPAYAGASTEARSLTPYGMRRRSQIIRARARIYL
jgi:HK97 family phage prohead protease